MKKKKNKRIQKAQQFILSDIWKMPLEQLPKSKLLLIKSLRVIIIAFEEFKKNRCVHRASALTFYVLLSIVPIAALIFGISKGFGFEELLKKELTDKLSSTPEIIDQVWTFSQRLLENTKGGLIAGVGLIILFYTVMRTLGNVESAFNDIWKVKKPRTWVRRFTDYLSVMLIAPIFLIASSSATVFISTQLKTLSEKQEFLQAFTPFIYDLLKLTPYLLIISLFTLMYIIIPNTKVNKKGAIIAGALAGTAYQVTQFFYIRFQINVSSYNAIYGSFAALPLFLFWMRISWLIVLFGAEIAYAVENVGKFAFEKSNIRISPFTRKALALLIVRELVHRFKNGEIAPTAEELSEKLKVPFQNIEMLLSDLVYCGLISEIVSQNSENRSYQPAFDINIMTLHSVLTALDYKIGEPLDLEFTPNSNVAITYLNEFWSEIEKSEKNIRIEKL